MPTLSTVTTRRELRDFLRLPWSVYAGDAAWVPPLLSEQRRLLDPRRHPCWRHLERELFLARHDGRAVGRIAAIAFREGGRQEGYFGFLETENDPAILSALLDAAAGWLRRRGVTHMSGPYHPTINYELGVLTHGFDRPPYFMMTHTPAYYAALLEQAGLRKALDFCAYLVTRDEVRLDGRLERVCTRLPAGGDIHIRPARMGDYYAELDRLGQIYNEAFGSHWGFVAMTAAEIRDMAAGLRRILDPGLVLFAEYRGEPAGFILGIPNVNEVLRHLPGGRLFPTGFLKAWYYGRRIRTARVMTVGIRPRFQHLGLGILLFREIARRLADRGYEAAEMSWVAEDNVRMNKGARALGGQAYKTYRVYEKDI